MEWIVPGGVVYQLGKLWGAELKISKLKLALNRQSHAHIRACEPKLALFTAWMGGPGCWVVWGAGLSSCNLQAAGLTPETTQSSDPPYHQGFGECDMIIDMAVTVTNKLTNKWGYGQKLAEELIHLKMPKIIIVTIWVDSNQVTQLKEAIKWYFLTCIWKPQFRYIIRNLFNVGQPVLGSILM